MLKRFSIAVILLILVTSSLWAIAYERGEWGELLIAISIPISKGDTFTIGVEANTYLDNNLAFGFAALFGKNRIVFDIIMSYIIGFKSIQEVAIPITAKIGMDLSDGFYISLSTGGKFLLFPWTGKEGIGISANLLFGLEMDWWEMFFSYRTPERLPIKPILDSSIGIALDVKDDRFIYVYY